MILTQGQESGLRMIATLREYGDRPRVAILAGLAGTGKTTLIKYAAEKLGGYPMVVAPTGKAAVRIRELTGLRAKTIHSWQYDAQEDPQTGEISYARKPPDKVERGEIPVLIIDEGSMLSEDLWEDLYDTCCVCRLNILVVGDPFQLPPVQKRMGEDGRPREFNVMSPAFASDARTELKEITRQAAESPIIRATALVRAGKIAEAVVSFQRVPSAQLVERAGEIVGAGGVVLVHRNETRNSMNRSVRLRLGRDERAICPGEPLLVLKNCYMLENYNGETMHFDGWIEPPAGEHEIYCWIRKKKAHSRFGVAYLKDGTRTEDGTEIRKKAILAEAEVFGGLSEVTNQAVTKTARIIYGGGIAEEPDHPETPEEKEARIGHPVLSANFGYAYTCHKAQGSEWPIALVVLEQSLRQNTEDGRRWIYTALTRAREKAVFCLGVKA